ncbi:MAG: transglycosylase SLT domain-containing protein [Terriglobales bacterium]
MRLTFYRFPVILLFGFAAATLGCQTAQKSTFMPPPNAQAPALVSSAAPQASSQKPPATATVITGSQVNPEVAKALAVDPIADLVGRVEKEYLAGQENYRNGHLEAAKQNFDAAFNLLLESGFDLQSDQRLEAELNRILDGTNSTELEALQMGDGFAEQKSEPAPIDEANELTPPVDENVKAKAEAEIKSTHSDLPLMMTDQVAGYINYFSTRGRGVLERALARSGRYEDMIRRTLKEEGVPQDLIYLAQAESGFHPLAVSRAGARGMWQFMASRAKGYGLERNWWVDERQDPERATHAAAQHLKDLYGEFGDWYLAMAAYNSGPGTVQGAVKRTGYADFWELYRRNVLPKETRNYVPIIVAVTIMAKNPDQYGLTDVVKEKPIPYDTVKIDYPIDLRLVAECVDASAVDLQDLNPSLLRLTTPKDSTFELHLPAGTADKFQNVVALVPVDKRVWWRYHKVQAGETLASIARTYHSSPQSIAEANDLNENAPSPEMRLIIPIAPGKESDQTSYAHAITRYKIRKGDTVESVAENFGVSAKMVRTWNRLKGDSLAGRKILLVHVPVTPGALESQLASKRTSSQRTASARASLDQSSAAAAKGKKASPQSVAQRARSQRAATTQSAGAQSHKSPARAETETTVSAVVRHKVKSGETLYSIANSYRTTVSALKKDNRNVATLRPGMILVIRDVR